MNLFSLSANAGAALAAAVVQPGAAGLTLPGSDDGTARHGLTTPNRWQDEPELGLLGEHIQRAGREPGGRCGGSVRGVVFESLDSRIMEEALVSAMGRLGLGMECRSRWDELACAQLRILLTCNKRITIWSYGTDDLVECALRFVRDACWAK